MSHKTNMASSKPKGHLLTAISFPRSPLSVALGFIIAIGMGLSRNGCRNTLTPGQFDVWQAMATLGAVKALGLLPVVIAVGISGSIAHAGQGIAPGFVVGLAANTISAGFIGGMIGGYIAGYIALAIIKQRQGA